MYKRSMLYDATYNSDDDEPMTLKRKLSYFFTGDSIKRLWEEQNYKLLYDNDNAKYINKNYYYVDVAKQLNRRDAAKQINKNKCWKNLVKNNKILINVVAASKTCFGCMTCENIRIVPASSLPFSKDNEAYCM